jgi:hypothetical protein
MQKAGAYVAKMDYTDDAMDIYADIEEAVDALIESEERKTETLEQ